ncbi:MAG: NADPH-dependent F420 reductase [Mycobacteriales bacterium]
MTGDAAAGTRSQPTAHPDWPREVRHTTIALLGGTGAQGRGLAYRFACAGIATVIGSRSAQRARAAADVLNQMHGTSRKPVVGESNAVAARRAGIVVAAVPWEGHAELLRDLAADLAGKVVIDCVNPIGFDNRGPYPLDVEEGSAAQQAALLLPDSTVVAAFHHVSAVLLADPSVRRVDCDVLVLGDDRDATDEVRALADLVPGMRGVYAGRLRNAGQIEALTANLVAVNRRYRTHAGVRLTGVPGYAPPS